MKYQPQNLRFSLEQRRMLNEKVLYLIDSHSCAQYDITGDDIFNAYTGIGGLHGLNREDFDNYHEYSEQKKTFESGQFLTRTPSRGQRKNIKFFRLAAHGCQLLLCRKA